MTAHDADALPTLDEVRRYRDVGVSRVTFLARDLAGGTQTVQPMRDARARFAETVIARLGESPR